MFKIDSQGATIDNQFTEGNPQNGVPATVVSAEWLNTVQSEIVNALILRGVGLDKTKNNQLSELFQRGVDFWNANFIYQLNWMCQIDGVVYISQSNNNHGNNPMTDNGTNWKAKVITNELYVKNSANAVVAKLGDMSSFLTDARFIGRFDGGGILDFYIGRYGVGFIILISDWGGACGVDAKIYAVSSASFGSYLQNIVTLQNGNANSLAYLGYTDPYLGRRYVQKFRASSSQATSVFFKPFLSGDGDEVICPII